MSTENTNVEDTNINIDDFLPMPGAESVVTSDDNKSHLFTSPNKAVDMTFIDAAEEEEDDDATVTVTDADAKLTLDALATDEDADEDLEVDPVKKKTGRAKTDKNGLVQFFKKRIEGNEMFAFDDFDETKQTLEDYLTNLGDKDIEELWTANIDNMRQEVATNTPKEFFESLPEELQYAAEYVAKGGQDLKGLFKALAQVEEVRELDIKEPQHQEIIVRQYLQATNFGNGDQELIDEQIQEWVEGGIINKKAGQFKPKLDDLQEEVLKAKLAQQDAVKQQQQAKKEAYMNNIYETLKPGELNGVKIDAKRQKFLWNELTTVKYESITGRPTNKLGKLLEDYQFGKEPRYDLIAETLWLLSDPEDYKEHIRTQAKNEVIVDTVRKLKTEEARKISSHVTEDEDDKGGSPVKKKIARNTNIFKR